MFAGIMSFLFFVLLSCWLFYELIAFGIGKIVQWALFAIAFAFVYHLFI